MRVSVSYVKQASYQGSVELDDGVIGSLFEDALGDGIGDYELDGTSLRLTLDVDIESIVSDMVEGGDVDNEEMSSPGEIADIEIEGLE